MVGTLTLTRSLPDTSPEIKRVSIVDDEGCELNIVLEESLVTYSAPLESGSSNIEQMYSSSLATSAILGLSSGKSLQHFKAKVKNLTAYSNQ